MKLHRPALAANSGVVHDDLGPSVALDILPEDGKQLCVRLERMNLSGGANARSEQQGVFANMSSAVHRHHAGAKEIHKTVGAFAVGKTAVYVDPAGRAGIGQPQGEPLGKGIVPRSPGHQLPMQPPAYPPGYGLARMTTKLR